MGNIEWLNLNHTLLYPMFSSQQCVSSHTNLYAGVADSIGYGNFRWQKNCNNSKTYIDGARMRASWSYIKGSTWDMCGIQNRNIRCKQIDWHVCHIVK